MTNLLVPRQLVNLSTKKSVNGLYKLISNTYLYIYQTRVQCTSNAHSTYYWPWQFASWLQCRVQLRRTRLPHVSGSRSTRATTCIITGRKHTSKARSQRYKDIRIITPNFCPCSLWATKSRARQARAVLKLPLPNVKRPLHCTASNGGRW